jgi:hypothetical protein
MARKLVSEGRRGDAEAVVASLIAGNFGLSVQRATINSDWTSLNSLNGIVTTTDARCFFFKFHQEEGEEATIDEYYRAELLQKHGLPIDVPEHTCRQPGHQILLYRYRRDRRLADACLDFERGDDSGHIETLTALQRDLDRLTGKLYYRTLHVAEPAQSCGQAVHQLFHHRLVDTPAETELSGRYARFYRGRLIKLPGFELPWERFEQLRWRINGITYRDTLQDLFRESVVRLAPSHLARGGAVVGHGDAHNANVWIEERNGSAKLVLFDPAFAGEHLPALLAEVKATFHNIFAHPFWLYHPAEADERFTLSAHTDGEVINIQHNWQLPALRAAFLDVKIREVWQPLMIALRSQGLLHDDWDRIVRTALFCCPTLVMNLAAGVPHGAAAGRSAKVSALSFAIAVMAGSRAEAGGVPFSAFMTALQEML